jgi:hypothetical protein
MTGKINVGKKVTEHHKVILKNKNGTLSSQASNTNE